MPTTETLDELLTRVQQASEQIKAAAGEAAGADPGFVGGSSAVQAPPDGVVTSATAAGGGVLADDDAQITGTVPDSPEKATPNPEKVKDQSPNAVTQSLTAPDQDATPTDVDKLKTDLPPNVELPVKAANMAEAADMAKAAMSMADQILADVVIEQRDNLQGAGVVGDDGRIAAAALAKEAEDMAYDTHVFLSRFVKAAAEQGDEVVLAKVASDLAADASISNDDLAQIAFASGGLSADEVCKLAEDGTISPEALAQMAAMGDGAGALSAEDAAPASAEAAQTDESAPAAAEDVTEDDVLNALSAVLAEQGATPEEIAELIAQVKADAEHADEDAAPRPAAAEKAASGGGDVGDVAARAAAIKQILATV